ncbi:hypothetical protein PRIPAC_75302, partial [Pristionchus pacificus]|uniref:Uncharacterized protein n=1 Tax=Pristionchus pacificus TaxID=54126 RepID=A0A2A6C8K0_PRIPA
MCDGCSAVPDRPGRIFILHWPSARPCPLLLCGCGIGSVTLLSLLDVTSLLRLLAPLFVLSAATNAYYCEWLGSAPICGEPDCPSGWREVERHSGSWRTDDSGFGQLRYTSSINFFHVLQTNDHTVVTIEQVNGSCRSAW